MTSYATPAEMTSRYDVRQLGDLVRDDGERATPAELLTDANLQTALDDASGEIDAALMQAQRYTPTELASLTGNSRAYLVRLTCMLAFAYLWNRRQWGTVYDDARDEANDKARRQLERLRKGEHVFDLEPQKDAGLPTVSTPTIATITNQNYVVDEARKGYYPARRLPNGY